VSPDRVRIISVTQFAGVRSMRHGGHKVQIQVRVTGALRLVGVDRALRRHGFPLAVVRTKVSRDHHVDARRKPVTKPWSQGQV
jgi:hypothetical protein